MTVILFHLFLSDLQGLLHYYLTAIIKAMATRSSSSHVGGQAATQRRSSGTANRSTNGVSAPGAVASGAGTSTLTQTSTRTCNGDSNKTENNKEHKILKYHKGLSPSAKR